MKTVWVEARLQDSTYKGLDDEDASALGRWEVELLEDLPPGLAAGAALDTFHENVAIGELDYFVFTVRDPLTLKEIEEADDFEQGSQAEGSIEFLGELA